MTDSTNAARQARFRANRQARTVALEAEVRRLKAELERYVTGEGDRAELGRYVTVLAEAEARIAALEAELVAAQAQAQRYVTELAEVQARGLI
jgi:hypothetical protein